MGMSIRKVDLTPEQKQMWTDTMSLMAWTAPGFRHLFFKLLANNNGNYTALMGEFGNLYTGDKGIACTDGQNIIVNPETFFPQGGKGGYSLKERVFIMAHEVAHNVYDDVGLLHRMKYETNIKCTDGKIFPYDEGTMQKAMDYRINAMLVESRIGHMPKDALYDPAIAMGKDGVFDIYGKVYKQDQNGGPKNPGQQPGHGNSQGQNGFDPGGVQPPGASNGQSPSQAANQRNPQQWAVELSIAKAIESKRTQGKIPGALGHMFDEILDPKVPWHDHITTVAKRIMGSGSLNWKKPDRRFIGRDLWVPSRSGEGAGWLVIWGDTSGSIGDKELNQYLSELKGMIDECKPSRLSIVWCDAAIHRIDDITDVADLETIKATGVGGRGGTDITPVFDWIAEQRAHPDMFIGLTDGCFTWPEQPAFPIVWGAVNSSPEDFPYGEVAVVNT